MDKDLTTYKKQEQIEVDLSLVEIEPQGQDFTRDKNKVQPMDTLGSDSAANMDVVEQVVVTSGPHVTDDSTIPTDDEDALLNSQPKETVPAESAESKQSTNNRVKLTGAARKRMKQFVEDGIDTETARILCQKPMRETRKEVKALTGSRKRVRSDGSTPPATNQPAKRTTGAAADGTPLKVDSGKLKKPATIVPEKPQKTTAAPSYKDVVAAMKIGVIPPDFPTTRWSDEQLHSIKRSILYKIVELKKGPLKPNFSNCSFKPGWISFVCDDKETVQWMETYVPEIKPWDGAVLKVVAEDEVPKAQVFVGYFPDKEDTSSTFILGMVEAQNRDLSVEYWKVLNNVVKGGVVEITLSIDPISAEVLKQKNYRVKFEFGTALVRPTRQPSVVERKKLETTTATVSATSAKSDKSASKPKSSDDKPGCSKHVPRPISIGDNNQKAKNKAPTAPMSNRPKKWERHSAEHAALLNSNRGRKVAKRAKKFANK